MNIIAYNIEIILIILFKLIRFEYASLFIIYRPPDWKFTADMVYSILVSKSCLLTDSSSN